MGGFFLDSIIRSIVKGVRREHRASTAAEWPIVGAAITTSSERGITYSYVVSGETWYGSCVAYPLRDVAVEKLRSTLDALQILRVRYDPADPGESSVLNRDNPKLPFEIDHDPY